MHTVIIIDVVDMHVALVAATAGFKIKCWDMEEYEVPDILHVPTFCNELLLMGS
jgi:hypothetical protein